MESLALRIQRLEDIEAIKQLKARYFHGCDRKNLDVIKGCFAQGDIKIDYGAIGCFSNREDFLAVYEQKACHAHIIDMHHGQNPQINWLSVSAASALWDLYFFQIDKQTGTCTQLAGFYEDQFRKIQDEWLIVETCFKVTSSLVTSIEEGHSRLLFAGP